MVEVRTRSCPLCQADEPRVQRRVDGWALASCRHCGFVYAPVVAAEIGTEMVLADDYDPPVAPRTHQVDRFLRKLVPADSLVVDVGTGIGDLGVLARRQAHYRCIGFEPSPTAAACAIRRGAEVRQELFYAASLDAPADAVVLDNVIEHVSDPVALMTEAVGGLRSGGVLLVIVPNRWDLRQLNSGWRTANLWVPPEHVNYFTIRSLRRVLGGLGLSARPFGFAALTRAEWKYWPRAVFETVGVYPFGLNVWARKP